MDTDFIGNDILFHNRFREARVKFLQRQVSYVDDRRIIGLLDLFEDGANRVRVGLVGE